MAIRFTCATPKAALRWRTTSAPCAAKKPPVDFQQEVDHQVTAAGLKSDSGLKPMPLPPPAATAMTSRRPQPRCWLFGNAGNDTLIGHAGGNLTFVGGSGDDILKGVGNGNTFLFSGDFGRDQLYGFNATDSWCLLAPKAPAGISATTPRSKTTIWCWPSATASHADRRFARSLQHRSGGVGLRSGVKAGRFRRPAFLLLRKARHTPAPPCECGTTAGDSAPASAPSAPSAPAQSCRSR